MLEYKPANFSEIVKEERYVNGYEMTEKIKILDGYLRSKGSNWHKVSRDINSRFGSKVLRKEVEKGRRLGRVIRYIKEKYGDDLSYLEGKRFYRDVVLHKGMDEKGSNE